MFFLNKKDKEPEDIKGVLKKFREMDKKVGNLEQELSRLRERGRFSVQKVGIVRFNPFSGVGGDQSFSVALLDADNNGVVVTSLFSQEGNRVYGKPIESGISKYTLSDEEKKAIQEAIKET